MRRSMILFALAATVLAGCEPMGPLAGGELRGELVTGPVSDWSFTNAYDTIQLETRPEDPHSITVWCFTHDGRLYVPSRSPQKKRWVEYVLQDPRVRVRIGGKIYERRAIRVTDEAEFAAAAPALLRKYDLEPHQGDSPEVWFFRLDAPENL